MNNNNPSGKNQHSGSQSRSDNSSSTKNNNPEGHNQHTGGESSSKK